MAAEKSKPGSSAAPDRRVVVTRVFDFPPERVFDAWLDPAAAGKWLFATPTGEMIRVEIDARVGGRFVFVDRRDGVDIEHTGEYQQIDRPRRLVFTFSVPKFSDEATRVTIDIAPRGSGCELTLTHEGVLPDYLERTKSGWTTILGRLGEILTRSGTMAESSSSLPPSGESDLVLTRVLDAPRALVFKVWTDPKHLAQWWGPNAFTNPVCEVDVRVGGAILIHMRGPDGTVYPMTGTYREIVEPERLVFISAALDEMGTPLFEILNTVTFAEQGGKTTLTVRAHVLNATPRATRHLKGAPVGWSQSLDRLAAYLMKL